MPENKTPNAPTLQILSQYIRDLSLEAPDIPFVFEGMTKPPKIAVNIDVQVKKTPDDKGYTVDLVTKITATRDDTQKTVFLLEMTYGALVTLTGTPDQIEPLLLVEVPHLIFPQVRSVIATLTREAGLPPLQINPINFAALFVEKMKNQPNATPRQ